MTALREAAEVLSRGGVVALTGAGISADSQIPTFREPGGVWDRFDPERFGTWAGLLEEAMSRPDALADFLGELRSTLARARPNPAHLALAELERAGLLDAVITQNVDGLHLDAGSRTVVEIHGTLRRQICLGAGHVVRVSREELVEGLDRIVRGLRTAFIPSLPSILPRCPACGAPSRPDFVAFGEPVRDLLLAEDLAAGCRSMLVVGTHGEVYPAGDLPRIAREHGATVLQLGPADTAIAAEHHLRGRAARVLPELVRGALDRLERPSYRVLYSGCARSAEGGRRRKAMPEFPSAEWMKDYLERINDSKEYREAAATWEGDISYVFEAEPDKGVPEEIWAWLDLWHGECRDAKYGIPQEEGEKAKFIIRAPYSRWKEVIKKELDPVKGMMQGKLKLKGDLPTIVRYVKAANELVNLAASVPTEFVDERAS